MIDVFLVVPLLLGSAILSIRKSRKAFYIEAGINLYLVYTYAVYSFGVHFNSFFIIYCVIFGIAFYCLILFLFHVIKETDLPKNNHFYPYRFTGIYFVIVSVLFYLLWLSDIVPAIVRHDVPQALKETGLLTNPIHVLDLAIVLPGIFVTGVLLMRGNSFAYRLTPVVLTFMVLMDITIIFLSVTMFTQGTIKELNSMMIAIMSLQTLVSLLLLRSSLKIVNENG